MRIPKLDLKKLLEEAQALPKRIWESFFIAEGEKKKINFKLIGLVLTPLVLAGSFLSIFSNDKDSSYLNQSSGKVEADPKLGSTIQPEEKTPPSHSSIIRDEKESSSVPVRSTRTIKIKYSAKQVIDRFGSMPAGTNFIGKLLTAIDTRDKGQMVKVMLPYGATYQGNRNIEGGSILFGNAHYAGSGDRVYLQFNRLVRTDGAEFRLQAQALNSKDFSPGLSGELYTNADSRIMATVGLSMLSAGADVLVEKESLGHSYEATPKSSLKNAAMAGISRGAQIEAERKMSETQSQESYVIVDSGSELIVSLTESFKGETENQK